MAARRRRARRVEARPQAPADPSLQTSYEWDVRVYMSTSVYIPVSASLEWKEKSASLGEDREAAAKGCPCEQLHLDDISIFSSFSPTTTHSERAPSYSQHGTLTHDSADIAPSSALPATSSDRVRLFAVPVQMHLLHHQHHHRALVCAQGLAKPMQHLHKAVLPRTGTRELQGRYAGETGC